MYSAYVRQLGILLTVITLISASSATKCYQCSETKECQNPPLVECSFELAYQNDVFWRDILDVPELKEHDKYECLHRNLIADNNHIYFKGCIWKDSSFCSDNFRYFTTSTKDECKITSNDDPNAGYSTTTTIFGVTEEYSTSTTQQTDDTSDGFSFGVTEELSTSTPVEGQTAEIATSSTKPTASITTQQPQTNSGFMIQPFISIFSYLLFISMIAICSNL